MIWLTRRLFATCLSAWLAVSFVFVGIRLLPGDALTSSLKEAQMSTAQIEGQRDMLGLSASLTEQYLLFWKSAITGDFGQSLSFGLPVSNLIAQRLWVTIELALASLIVAILLGLILGIAASRINEQPIIAWVSDVCINISISVPLIVSSTIAIMLMSTNIDLLSASGSGALSHLLFPTFVLGYHSSGAIARATQQHIIATNNANFIRYARSKGVSEPHIVKVHVTKNVVPPIARVITLQAGFLLAGTIVTETVFVRPGLGTLLLSATIQRDYAVLQTLVLMSTIVYAIMSIVTDLIHAVADPRITQIESV